MRSPVPPKTRGLCGTCKHDYRVRRDGRLPTHGRQRECGGSREWPQAYKAPGGKWKAALP
jgi:hypothetical protein